MSTAQPKATNLPLFVGFALLLIMMVVQLVLALSEIRSIRESMELVVNEKLVKNNLANTMLAASRERGLILTLIYYEEDPFERDELHIKFSNHAGEFLAAREQLYAMALSSEERKALDDLAEHAMRGTPAMERVLELILSEEGMNDREREEAMWLIRDEAIPAREAVGEYLRVITDLTQQSSEQAIAEAEADYYRLWNQMLLLAGGIVLLSMVIAVVVYRKVTRAAKQVEEMHLQMRQQVSQTVRMFKVSVALIEHSMSGGDHSIRDIIDQLTEKARLAMKVRSQLEELHQWREAFTQGCSATDEHRAQCSVEFDQVEREVAGDCQSLDHTFDEAIVTFQDFDRISQQLTHIGHNLNETADLINDPKRINDEREWNILREKMRENFVMMDAQVLYDAIMNGEDKDEALRKANETRKDSLDNFEMF